MIDLILLQVYINNSTVIQTMLKTGNLNRQIKINPQLRRVITDTLAKNPDFDEVKVFEKIKQSKLIRMPEGSIKVGIEVFFKDYKRQGVSSSNQIRQPPKENGKQLIEINVDSLPKKKVKKNEFMMLFEDNEKYKFANLGGITEIFREIETELFSLILHDSLYKMISELSPNRGFLLTGSPGSGKTLLANCILSYLSNLAVKKITAYSVSSFEFLGSDADQKLKKLFETAEETLPAIIFIDNIEELCNKDNNKRMQSLPYLSLSNYMNKFQDKQIYFLATSSVPEKLDSLTKPGMFYKQIKISNPDQSQRKQILQKLLIFYKHSVSENLKELSLMTAGYVAVDINSLLKQATVRCIERLIKIPESSQRQNIIILQDIKEAFKYVQPILKKDGFAKIPNVKLEDVGALENIKEQLTQQIIMPLREQQKFKNMNFEVNGGGILLYGPPGCGKTMIAKAIANQANANFITVKGPQLLTKYVGESEQAVRKVFERAKMSAPCIIFFDQFDALAPKRQDQGNQVTERVVNTLLNQLNGVDDRKMVFVIAATNRPDIIDEAVLRSGRIQKHLYVPLPNQKQRLQILIKITRKVNHEQNLDLEDIAARTENFSGADLYFLIKKSILSAISRNSDKINSQNLKSALQTYKQDKYNKKNRLRLSQFDEENQQQQDKEETDNLLEQKSNSVKKSKSMMEIQENQQDNKGSKKKVKESLLQNFMDYLLAAKKNSKGNQNKM